MSVQEQYRYELLQRLRRRALERRREGSGGRASDDSGRGAPDGGR